MSVVDNVPMARCAYSIILILIALGLVAPVVAQPAASGWIEEEKESRSVASGAGVDFRGGKVTLKLGIEHADKLAPVPNKLQVGSTFDEKRLASDFSSLKWYRIPKWLSGKWKRQNETIFFEHDFQTGQVSNSRRSVVSEQTADFGVQLDKKGHVWHCNLATRGVSSQGNMRTIALVELQEPVRISSFEIVFKEVFTILEVLDRGNIISKAHKVESLTRYRPVKNGLLETSMSIKTYYQSGAPKNEQHNVSYDRVIKRFAPLNSYKGEDLKAGFIEFLKTTDRLDLIPD